MALPINPFSPEALHQEMGNRAAQTYAAQAFAPTTPGFTMFTSAYKQTENLTTSAASWLPKVGKDKSPQLTAEEAALQFNIKVDRPVTLNEAEYLSLQQHSKNAMDETLARVDSSAFGTSLYPLLGSLAKGALDPLGGILSMASGGLLGTVPALAERALLTTLLSNIGENTVQEIAAIHKRKQVFGEETPTIDSIQNIAISTAAGTSIHFLLSKLGSKAKAYLKSTDAEKAAGVETVLTQHNEGKTIDPLQAVNESERTKWLHREKPIGAPDRVPVQGEVVDFASLKTNHPTLYAVKESPTGNLSNHNHRVLDSAYGEGITVTAHDHVAKNTARNTINPSEGAVVKVNMPGSARVLNIEAPVKTYKSKLVAFVKAAHGSGELNSDNAAYILDRLKDRADPATYREILEILAARDGSEGSELVEKLNAVMRKEGIKAYSYEGGREEIGKKASNETYHQALHIIDDKNIMVSDPMDITAHPNARVDENLPNTKNPKKVITHMQDPATDAKPFHPEKHTQAIVDRAEKLKVEDDPKIAAESSKKELTRIETEEIKGEFEQMDDFAKRMEADKTLLDKVPPEQKALYTERLKEGQKIKETLAYVKSKMPKDLQGFFDCLIG